MLNSNCEEKLTCPHIESTRSAVTPACTFFNIPSLQEYDCSETVRNELMRLQSTSGDLPIAVKVSPTMFCVFGPVTSNTPVGYSHVQLKDEVIRCFSKDCKTIISRAKQQKAKTMFIFAYTAQPGSCTIKGNTISLNNRSWSKCTNCRSCYPFFIKWSKCTTRVCQPHLHNSAEHEEVIAIKHPTNHYSPGTHVSCQWMASIAFTFLHHLWIV